MVLTRVFPSFVSVDKAGDQDTEDEESYGAHQANEPALGRDAFVAAGQTCREGHLVTSDTP